MAGFASVEARAVLRAYFLLALVGGFIIIGYWWPMPAALSASQDAWSES